MEWTAPEMKPASKHLDERIKPLVATRERNIIQAWLMEHSDTDPMAWIEKNAPLVSKAFVDDPELVELARTKPLEAAEKLQTILATGPKKAA